MNEAKAYLTEWDTDGKDRRTYKVPALFYCDHADRSCGYTDKIINRGSKIITVELDYAGYNDLLSDADYYWECREDFEMPALCASAKRTLNSLAKQEAPAQKVDA